MSVLADMCVACLAEVMLMSLTLLSLSLLRSRRATLAGWLSRHCRVRCCRSATVVLLLLLLLLLLPAAGCSADAPGVAPAAAAALRVVVAVIVLTLRHAQLVHAMIMPGMGRAMAMLALPCSFGDHVSFLALRSPLHRRDERAQRCR
jgi:hypothetical protein